MISTIKNIRIKKAYAILGMAICILQSCSEDVIDIDLNSSRPKYVIEGVITNVEGDGRVTITQTVNFDQDNNFPPVSGAEVSIVDDLGNTTVLEESSPGVYEAPTLTAVENRTYVLTVVVDGQTFTAQSTMPSSVPLDDLYFTEELLFGDSSIISNVEFNDPAGTRNYYNFRQWVNGVKTRELYPLNDELTDGNHQSIKLYMFDAEDDEEIKSGDTITVEMQCTDADVYMFWYSAQQGATGESSGAGLPSNPVSNIQGDALGYFSAHTSQYVTVVVD